MKKFQSSTIDSAILEATKYFNCSLLNLDYEILQYPSNGFLGFNKKDAIILAIKKEEESIHETSQAIKSLKQDEVQKEFDNLVENKSIQLNEHEELDFEKELNLNRAKKIQENLNANNADLKTANNANDFRESKKQDSNFMQNKEHVNLDSAPDFTFNFEKSHVDFSRDIQHDNLNKNQNIHENVQDRNLLNDKKQNIKNIDKNAYKSYPNPAKNVQMIYGYENKNAQDNKNIIEKIGETQDILHNMSNNENSNIENKNIKYDGKNESANIKDIENVKDENIALDSKQICEIVKNDLKDMLSELNIDLSTIEVSIIEDNMMYIFIDGKDLALLIGENGYRYNALSYLLFNWINQEYDYDVRLEIGEFFKNQEKMLRKYLHNVSERVRQHGSAQTRVLDYYILNLALKILREEFPNKYISSRENDDGKYIIVDDFLGEK